MKDLLNNPEVFSDSSDNMLDTRKYTEVLAQQLSNSPMPAVVAVQGSWDFGRSFFLNRLRDVLCNDSADDEQASRYFGIRITVPECSDEEDGSGKVLSEVLKGMEKGCTDVMRQLQVPDSAGLNLMDQVRDYLKCSGVHRCYDPAEAVMAGTNAVGLDGETTATAVAEMFSNKGKGQPQEPTKVSPEEELKAKAEVFLKNARVTMQSAAVRAAANAVGLDGEAAVSAVAQEVLKEEQTQDPSKQSVEELKEKALLFVKKSGAFVSSTVVKAGAHAVGLDGDAATPAVAQEVSKEEQTQVPSKLSVEEFEAIKAKALSFLKKSGTFALSSAAKAGSEVAGLDGDASESLNDVSDSAIKSSAQKLSEAFSQAVDNCLKAQPEGRPARRGFMFLIDGLEHVNPACAVKDLALLKNIFNVRNSVFVLSIDSSFIAKGLKSESGDASKDPEAFIGGIAQSSFSYPVTAQDVTEFLKTSLKNAGCFGAEDLSREISLSLPVTGLTNTVLGIIAEMTRLSAGPDANGISQIVEILSGMKGGQSDTSEAPAPTLDDIDRLVWYGLGCLLVSYPEVYDYIVKNPASMVWNEEQISRFRVRAFFKRSNILALKTLTACKNVMSQEESLFTCNDDAFGMKMPGLNASKLLVIIRSLTAPDQLEGRIRRITALISENMDSVPEEETSAEPDTISERRQATLDARYSFWKSFLSYAFKNPEFAEHFRKKKPTQGSWVTFGIGATGCHIGVTFNIRKNELRAELFIRDDRKLYFTLASQKKAIEAEAGLSFEWRDVGGKNSSIRIENHSFKLASKRDRHKQFDWLIDVVLRMRKAFVKYL